MLLTFLVKRQITKLNPFILASLGPGTQSIASLPGTVSVASSAVPTMQVSAAATAPPLKMNASASASNQPQPPSAINQSYNANINVQPRHSNNSIDYGYQATGPGYSNATDFNSVTSSSSRIGKGNKNVFFFNHQIALT